MNKKKCYACLNWDGNRTLDAAKKTITVDLNEKANCKLWHKLFAAKDECDKINQIH
ncbi:MAG TPA: hypothetical protein PKO22_08070 [Treponemataceae bacterium]|nr:hypothetical protein [Treponemataceae bacterium]